MHYLVTGANRGIGLELVRQLVAQDHHVIAACRQPDAATALHDLKAQSGAKLMIVALDVTDPVSIAACYDSVQQHTDRLDVLINNAAMGGSDETLGHLTQETLLSRYTANAAGPILVAQQFLHMLKAGTQPQIINMTTGISSITTRDQGGMYSYTASKSALNMLNRNLSLDVAEFGITCIVIDPGWVKTDMGGPNAMITAEESVSGILQVSAQLTPTDTGKFFHYSGDEIPW